MVNRCSATECRGGNQDRGSVFSRPAGGTQTWFERSSPMLIGVPKEVKTHEYRVGLVPGSVRELVHHGHKVIVEAGAGTGIGFADTSYEAAGAGIVASAAGVFTAA